MTNKPDRTTFMPISKEAHRRRIILRKKDKGVSRSKRIDRINRIPADKYAMGVLSDIYAYTKEQGSCVDLR